MNLKKIACTHSEVELRKCCLGQSEKSEIPYYLIKFKIVQGPLNAVRYKDDILDPIVLPFLQHDNAICHVARVCQDFLNQNHILVLSWPAFSPDLPPIEHLWDELGKRVCHGQNPAETLQELRDAFVHEWHSIPQAFFQRLIGSVRRRCEAVVAARGSHTRY